MIWISHTYFYAPFDKETRTSLDVVNVPQSYLSNIPTPNSLPCCNVTSLWKQHGNILEEHKKQQAMYQLTAITLKWHIVVGLYENIRLGTNTEGWECLCQEDRILRLECKLSPQAATVRWMVRAQTLTTCETHQCWFTASKVLSLVFIPVSASTPTCFILAHAQVVQSSLKQLFKINSYFRAFLSFIFTLHFTGEQAGLLGWKCLQIDRSSASPEMIITWRVSCVFRFPTE